MAAKIKSTTPANAEIFRKVVFIDLLNLLIIIFFIVSLLVLFTFTDNKFNTLLMNCQNKFFFFLFLSCFFLVTVSFKPLFDGGSGQTKVMILTDMGVIKIRLYNETPLHRDNFIKLIKQHYYDSLLFHRVIQNFMIQGGDPDSKRALPDKELGDGGPAYTIPAEFNPKLFHKKGVLAAAREGDLDNPSQASSGSQFYIVQGKVFTDTLLKVQAKRITKMKLFNQIINRPENQILLEQYKRYAKATIPDSIKYVNDIFFSKISFCPSSVKSTMLNQ